MVGLGVAAALSPTVQTLRPLLLTSIAQLPPKHRCGKLFCVCVYLFLWLCFLFLIEVTITQHKISHF